jgi:hypothetical protein
MKVINLDKVKKVVQKASKSDIVGLDDKMFAYVGKLSPQQAWEDGYRFAMRDVLISLDKLAEKQPKSK